MYHLQIWLIMKIFHHIPNSENLVNNIESETLNNVLVNGNNLEMGNQNLINNLSINENVTLDEDSLVNSNNNNDVEDAHNQPAFKTMTDNLLVFIVEIIKIKIWHIFNQTEFLLYFYDSQIKTFKNQHDIHLILLHRD